MINSSSQRQAKEQAQRADRHPVRHPVMRRLLRAVGWIGVLVAVPFFIWLPAAWIGLVPSMIDTFGVVGLRTPASITIGGLLLAAIGFHKF